MFPTGDQLLLIDKVAKQLTSSEMMAAVDTAIQETGASDPELSQKWQSVSQMCPRYPAPRAQAIALIKTTSRKDISLQALEAEMDAAIERKRSTEGHIDHCLTALERVCTDNGIEITDRMRAGFKGAVESLAAKAQGARPLEKGTWVDRAQRPSDGGVPPFS